MAITKWSLGKKRQHQDDSSDDNDSVNEPQVKRIACDFNDMLTILVGDEERRFTVHQDMICAKSKFFKAACSKRWASGREKIVRPPEGTPEQFQTYVEWVYTSHVNVDAEDANGRFAQLMDMHILGDVIDDYQLRNATMERLISDMTKGAPGLNIPLLHKVYDATVTGSPLRQFLVNWLLVAACRKGAKQHVSLWPAELLEEFAAAALGQVPLMNDKDVTRFMRSRFEPETE